MLRIYWSIADPDPTVNPKNLREIIAYNTLPYNFTRMLPLPQVAVLAGYALNGGGFNNYLGALGSRGLIKGDCDRLTITDAGIETLGSWEPLPTGSALVDYWRGRLGKAERLILETLTQVYPDALTKEEVAVKAGYEANGGGFNNALGRLRTLELVGGRGEIKASDNLFVAG